MAIEVSTEEIERLLTQIGEILDREEEPDVSSTHRRAVMVLQQFYRKLLSDFSPRQHKEMRLFLHANGFPTLRDAIKIKPSKLPEKLEGALSAMKLDEAKKKQLQDMIERLRGAVSDLDSAIYSSMRHSSKAEQAADRLTEIQEGLEELLVYSKRIGLLNAEIERLNARITEMESRSAREAASDLLSRSAADRTRSFEQMKHSISAAEKELSEMKEKFKQHLISSGEGMRALVALLPRMKSLISGLVKSDSPDLSSWDFQVALRHRESFFSSASGDETLNGLSREELVSALEYAAGNEPFVMLYNEILRSTAEIEKQRLELEMLHSEVRELESGRALNSLISEEESRRESIKSQLAGLQEELRQQEMEAERRSREMGIVGGDMSELMKEVEKLRKRIWS